MRVRKSIYSKMFNTFYYKIFSLNKIFFYKNNYNSQTNGGCEIRVLTTVDKVSFFHMVSNQGLLLSQLTSRWDGEGK